MERQVDVMTDVSFCHLASAGKKISTEKIVENNRKHYPDAYYFLGSDAADDLSEIGLNNKCDYYPFSAKVGYPSYDLKKLLLWFERFKLACQNCNTSHIMMMEDDVWIKKQLSIEDDWEMAGHDIRIGNIIPDFIIDSIEEFSGKRPLTNQYGCGGGSIFKVSTFLNNYDRVIVWFEDNHDMFQQQYMPLGFMDCYMVVYYMLCGKDYSVNPYLTDTHHHQKGFDFDKFVEDQPAHIEIVNNYKKYYWPADDEVLTFRTEQS
jgi:hypothetical protein